MSSPDTDIHSETVHAIREECTALSIAYARCVDFRDYDAFVELFAEDGELDVGRPLIGRVAIAEAMSKRPDELKSRHVLSNIFIDVVDADHARGISYLTLYRHIGLESLTSEPIEFSGPAAVGHYEDQFVRTAAGFLIKRRRLHLAFRRAAQF
jgi:hypothetical protein